MGKKVGKGIGQNDVASSTITDGTVQSLPVCELFSFKNHPYKVCVDDALRELAQSISDRGVLTPIIVRPRSQGGYELISGHRRKAASEIAGKTHIPAIIMDIDDDSATIIMVDSNQQRDRILPSEKAFAYKMKLAAISHQGKAGHIQRELSSGKRKSQSSVQVEQRLVRNSFSTSVQVEPKITIQEEDASVQVEPKSFMHSTTDDNTSVQLEQKLSRAVIAAENGESPSQVQRYIRLTYLIPSLLKMVDDGNIAMSPAVCLSYLTKAMQKEVFDICQVLDCTPSFSQAVRLKKQSQAGTLTAQDVVSIMSELKANQKDKITFRADSFAEFFPKGYTPEQMEKSIIRMLKERKQC